MSAPSVAGVRRAALWPVLAMAAFLVAFPYAVPYLGGSLDTANRILDWGLFGLGFDLLFGFAGLLSFGQAAFFGVGGFVASYLLVVPVTSNALLALLVGTVVAGAVGIFVGYLSLRRTGIYFAMLTLAFGEMFYFLDISPLARFTGGENGLAGVPAPQFGFGFGASSPFGVYWFIAALFFLGFWFALRLIQSPFGTVLRAIRDNGERTAAVGHDVPKYKLTVFVIAAAYGGLAGGLLGLLQGYMPPDAFYLETSGQLVVQTIIGGAGTLIGPLVGAAVWLDLYTVLQNVAGIGALWKMILGVIFVLLVTVFRRGLCGGVALLWQYATAVSPSPSAEAETEAPPFAGVAQLAPEPGVRAARPLTGPVVLATHNLSKRYGGLAAVDDVSFELREGEFRAVIGPNGAGKSTFFNMLASVIAPSSGRIEFKGNDITGLGATRVCQLGIAKSFQINQLFISLTVRENLRIPAIARTYGTFHPSMLKTVGYDAAVNARIAEAAEAVQLIDRLDTPAAELAYGEKRRLEVGLALATQPQVLLLDEPTAGMSPAERADTVRLLKRIGASMTIVIVEHDMDVVFGLADRITVLFNGRKIAEDTPEAIQANPEVRAAYLGSQAAHEPA